MLTTIEKEIRHFHLFCGSGGGAKGFNAGHARVKQLKARFRCTGGIDLSPAAIRDFQKLSGVPGTVLDLFDRRQYIAFHGHEPPEDWREATPEDIRRASGYERPHIIFLSAPCKGFSGLLPEARSKSPKYLALNELTLRGMFLVLEAWADDPPELIVFENVPRIQTRGRHLLDQISALLRHYGYAVAETTHDCGQLGHLAQSRKRFLLVARHTEKVPNFLYEPIKRPLRNVGDILGRMPMPDTASAGAMHRLPSLQWRTWLRLALVKAGSDWRSLNELAVENGFLKDYAIIPEATWRDDTMGVIPWNKHAGAITAKNGTSHGKFAIADIRTDYLRGNVLGVHTYSDSCGTVTSRTFPSNGAFCIADPNPSFSQDTYRNVYRVVRWDEPSRTITGARHLAGGALAVPDPRCAPFGTQRTAYQTGGHYGVRRWDEPTGSISASACHDNGGNSVADIRLPDAKDALTCMIISLDGTWHRPFTTLELAALQGLLEPEDFLELDGLSDTAWRERIGNAVPPPAAAAIASVMGEVLLLTWSGETFSMNASPIWVQPMTAALMTAQA